MRVQPGHILGVGTHPRPMAIRQLYGFLRMHGASCSIFAMWETLQSAALGSVPSDNFLPISEPSRWYHHRLRTINSQLCCIFERFLEFTLVSFDFYGALMLKIPINKFV